MDDGVILAEIQALRGDMNAGHRAISDQMNGVAAALQRHELQDALALAEVDKRLLPLEAFREYVKKGAMAAGAAVVGALVKRFTA